MPLVALCELPASWNKATFGCQFAALNSTAPLLTHGPVKLLERSAGLVYQRSGPGRHSLQILHSA